MGTPKQKQLIKVELEKTPLMCGEIQMKLVDKVKWLGQMLSTDGLADSVDATVTAREGKTPCWWDGDCPIFMGVLLRPKPYTWVR